MDIETIGKNYKTLNNELRQALSTMEYSDKIVVIRSAIKDLQKLCPHNTGSFDFSTTDQCPYCGKTFKG